MSISNVCMCNTGEYCKAHGRYYRSEPIPEIKLPFDENQTKEQFVERWDTASKRCATRRTEIRAKQQNTGEK